MDSMTIPAGTSVKRPPIEKVDRTPVMFRNTTTGAQLAGILYRPRNRKAGVKLPALLVSGPMGSVKELTQSLYGQLLAEQGYATFVLDNTYVGSSEGHPRGYEDPDFKANDYSSAITYLQSLTDIDGERIAGIGICGSGSYIPYGAIKDNRFKVVASIVPFTIMDQVVTGTDEQLLQQKVAYEAGGEPARLNLIEPGSEGAQYYFNPERGAAANMVNLVTWSQISWHKFHPTQFISQLKVPYLVITAENAFTRPGAEEMFKNANEPKEFHLVAKARHFDMYDLDPYVTENMGYLLAFLKKYL